MSPAGAGLMDRLQKLECVPQGLKPGVVCDGGFGTTEVVPFHMAQRQERAI
jgi:hypothetical protein